MKIDELTRRRPTFVPGVPIMLDGQEWHFPRPKIRYRLGHSDGVPTLARCFTFGPNDDALDFPFATRTGGDGCMGCLALASAMLLANYELSDDEVSSLLSADILDPDPQVWIRILDLLTLDRPLAGDSRAFFSQAGNDRATFVEEARHRPATPAMLAALHLGADPAALGSAMTSLGL
jgi:hypothetical protein